MNLDSTLSDIWHRFQGEPRQVNPLLEMHRRFVAVPDEMLDDQPKACDRGVKKNAKGFIEARSGNKLLIDAAHQPEAAGHHPHTGR